MDTTSESFATSVGLLRNILTRNIAIDCEMMHANIGQVLGRVSIVNHEGQTVFDTFLCYPESIEITNTHQVYSGIDWDDIDQKNGTQPFSEVQTRLVELLHDRTVIGHDIKKDLRAISMDVPACASKLQDMTRFATPIAFDVTVRDTQKYSGYRKYANRGAYQGPSLKNLSQQVLGRPIKQRRVSSVEDAFATMEVYRSINVVECLMCIDHVRRFPITASISQATQKDKHMVTDRKSQFNLPQEESLV